MRIDMSKHNILLVVLALLFASCGDDSEDNTMMDEFSATVSVTASSTSVSEGDGAVSFNVRLSSQNTSGNAISIPFNFSGSASSSVDYEVSGSAVSIAPNESTSSVQVNLIDDMEVEGNETIEFALSSLPSTLSGSNTSATVTIMDNDEDNSGPGEITISIGNTTNSSVRVNQWTNNGADSYIVLINNEDSFTDLSNQSSLLPSTTYIGFDQQVVYNSTSINSFDVSLLSSNSTYFLKVVSVSSGTYDNSQPSTSVMTDATCETTSTTESQVCFEVNEMGDTRTISSNQYPSHAVGNFPNADPTATEIVRELDLTPTFTNQAIYLFDETGPPTPSNDNFWKFGMAVNGVEFHPMGLKPWENPSTGEENWEWQEKVTEEGETHLDAFGAHVTSQGNYHYHGDILGLATDEDGSRHSLIYGFAADGFPIYYKYGYSDPNDPTSNIVELTSSYQLKSGARTSNTGTAGVDYPDGNHDGTYIQDFEYVTSLGDLDECNGRTGVTPEYPEGTYYYVITSAFPVVPNCFFGTPAEDWKIGK